MSHAKVSEEFFILMNLKRKLKLKKILNLFKLSHHHSDRNHNRIMAVFVAIASKAWLWQGSYLRDRHYYQYVYEMFELFQTFSS